MLIHLNIALRSESWTRAKSTHTLAIRPSKDTEASAKLPLPVPAPKSSKSAKPKTKGTSSKTVTREVSPVGPVVPALESLAGSMVPAKRSGKAGVPKKLRSTDRQRLSEKNCGLFVGVPASWIMRYQTLWAAAHVHVSYIYSSKVNKDIGDMKEIIQSRAEYFVILETFEYRDNFLDPIVKTPISYFVDSIDVPVDFEVSKFGQDTQDPRFWIISAPGTNGLLIGDTLQAHFIQAGTPSTGFKIRQYFNSGLCCKTEKCIDSATRLRSA